MAHLKDMQRDEARDPRPHAPGDRSKGARGLGVVVMLALVTVVILLATGIRGLVHERPEVAPPSPVTFRHETPNGYTAPPTGATEPGPPPLADVSFVDVSTGRSRPLPRSIRSVSPFVRGFRVSPDGSRLAFAADGRIYVSTGRGRHIRVVVRGGRAPSWAPDGGRLVFQRGGGAWITDLETGDTTRVFGRRRVYRPGFTPDGQRILFSAARDGRLALWTAPVGGGRARLLLPRAAFGAYSPDGSAIAYRRTSFDGSDFTEMTQERLWIAAADDLAIHGVGPNRAWMSQGNPDALWPVWSPSGSLVAYERLYRRGIIVLDPGTGRVVTRLQGTDPSWLDDRTLIITDYGGVKG